MRLKILDNLIAALHALPGISKKQAEKIAYHILTNKKQESLELSQTINQALTVVKKCQNCGHLSDQQICQICQDNNRQKILVVVENSLDVFKFENSKTFKAYYHVLGGIINISQKINVNNLNLANLAARAKDFSEIIIALSPNMEGIVTANYVKELLRGHKVTQLAQGIPLGAAMEYVDQITLKAAFDNRKEVK